ncbi:DUF3574 domain-containing protein [Xanthobacter sp. DSM 24535]|uniref:DUF3574 domain-containing protein n=1 Tax=Roseixanthobacter psychrophilus TaxID=3119917 RepID=UPI003729094B
MQASMLFRTLLLGAVLVGPAHAQDAPAAAVAPGWQPTPWADSVFLESQLFFNLNTPDGRGVSEQQWVQFVADVVAPRFPGGFTVLEAQGLSASAPAPQPAAQGTPAPAASSPAPTTATAPAAGATPPVPAPLSTTVALALSRPGTRVLVIVLPNTPDAATKLGEVKSSYIKRFGQQRVFHVDFPVRVYP